MQSPVAITSLPPLGGRSWLRGIEEVRKRHLMAATAYNLGLVLRKLLGTGKVREFGSRCAGIFVQYCGVIGRLARWGSCANHLRDQFRKHALNYALVT